MVHESVPGGNGEFACHGDSGLVASSAQGEGESPFAKRILDLQEALGSLDEQGADGAATVAFDSAATFPIATLSNARIQTEIGHEFSGICGAMNIADGGGQAVDADEVETGEAGQTQEDGILGHFESHLVAQFLAAGTGADEPGVHLPKEQGLDRGPLFEGLETLMARAAVSRKPTGNPRQCSLSMDLRCCWRRVASLTTRW